jgi:hypothetical protein
MHYKGSCHCGQIAFEVEGKITEVIDCNCSMCSRKGTLMWFVSRDKLHLLTPEEDLATYMFGEHTIRHHFCPKCGIHPFGESTDPSGNRMAAINVRCLEVLDFSSLPVNPFDGRSL